MELLSESFVGSGQTLNLSSERLSVIQADDYGEESVKPSLICSLCVFTLFHWLVWDSAFPALVSPLYIIMLTVLHL